MAPPQRSKGAVIGEVGTNHTQRGLEHSAHFEHSPYLAFILYFYAEILVSYFKVRSGFRRNCDLNRAR